MISMLREIVEAQNDVLKIGDFKDALKKDDYGFRVGAITGIMKKYLVGIFGKELKWSLPGNSDEPGEGKGYFKINGKTVNVDFDTKDSLIQSISSVNAIVKKHNR